MRNKKKIAILFWRFASVLLLVVAFLFADYLNKPAEVPGTPVSEKEILKSEGQANNKNGELDRLAALNGVPVLMYHHIGDLPVNSDAVRRDLTVSAENFALHVQFLKNHGFETISTEQLYAHVIGKYTLPLNPILLTFDDGYEDTFKNAVPLLAANKMTGVFAVITGYAGFPGYASWEDIARAQDLGMEIIPHTRHHIDLKNNKYSYAQKSEEIIGSISDIKNHLGKAPVAFVYPYGNYSEQAFEILRQAGIKIAFTTKFGMFTKSGSMLLEPRVRVHGVEDLQKFENLLVLASKKTPKQ